jgi:hypothetical protein
MSPGPPHTPHISSSNVDPQVLSQPDTPVPPHTPHSSKQFPLQSHLSVPKSQLVSDTHSIVYPSCVVPSIL